ncbi:MAG: BMC domain-containing protein [Planctomycetota bacterium]
MIGQLPFRIDTEHFTTLAVLETSSIAQGIEALDAIIKEAAIQVLLAAAASPGKYLVLFTGEVDEAVRSLARGIEVAADTLVDDLLLPSVANSLAACLTRKGEPPSFPQRGPLPALGVLETYSGPSLLGAADTAVKTGNSTLLEVHLLAGIGGKSTALLYGDVESVRVAVDAGAEFALQREQLARQVVIPQPARAMLRFLTRGEARSGK